MSRRLWPWLAGIGLIVIAGVWLGGGTGAVSSAMSRGGSGWLAAHRYLAARGARVHLRDQPLTTEPEAEVLVLAFPWQQPVRAEEIEAVGGFLRRGGTLLVAYSGELGQFVEERVLESLGLNTREVRPPPPLAPLAWWRYHNESWRLELTEAWEGPAPEVSLPALRAAPEAPFGARVLYRLPAGAPLIFDYPFHRGRVVVLPAAVLSNANLADAGNADFLESLRDWLGDDWCFDEYHHGLVGPEAVEESTSRFAWDLFVGHLALIYVLGLGAVARRFGPAWREPPVTSGSTSSFLRSLGVLHQDLSHYNAAAALLVERARAYDPALPLDDKTEKRSRQVADSDSLVELARQISRAQRRRNEA
ncbi:MAG: DUF4350 domain-containing protein [bacterium]|nr:DUF4350 domain-containing protein [bacterium]